VVVRSVEEEYVGAAQRLPTADNRIVFDEELNYLDAKRDLYLPRYDQEASGSFERPGRFRRSTEGCTKENTITRSLAHHSRLKSIIHLECNLHRRSSIESLAELKEISTTPCSRSFCKRPEFRVGCFCDLSIWANPNSHEYQVLQTCV
jgi:hypothetical protein